MRVMGVDFVEPHSDVPPSPGRAQAWQDLDGSGDFELRYVDHRGELVRASLEPADGYSIAGEWLGRHRVLALVSPHRGEVAGGRYAHSQGWRHVAVTRPGDGETIGLALLP
ncbi:hypothetical protein [Aeromicrobium piscarium]|uniref:Uncharacterized protein n=1 Tax=Aeromicrobium piscarium TaxID=2590901 RepID=A0A554RXC5_9ACTN|nr:hypothetical protein [Aeromicrobium piscarium]TSD58759.1 hypothetical protein FNM00_13965 [Aeromicrobium piscarium]